MFRWRWRVVLAATLGLVPGVVAVTAASVHAASDFPTIHAWLQTGAYQDSTIVPVQGIKPTVLWGEVYTCPGVLGDRPDSLREQARTVSLRFLRDVYAESRPDFGGYRIYRMVGTPDTTKAVLIRRYSLNVGSELTWHFTVVDSASGKFRCADFPSLTATRKLFPVADSLVGVATFVDPDSDGDFIKICDKWDINNRCVDSVFKLIAPPGPHDGFRTWYSITYESRNTTDNNYEDLFLPDTLDNFARCTNPSDRGTCPNLNSKLRNLVGPIEPTGGPTQNLEAVHVVPNPYNGHEVWDQTGQNEIHFVNLPSHATIKIFTVAGDLVRVLHHDDTVRDFERWDLMSDKGHLVTSGIYIYRVESSAFTFQNRFIVIL